MRRLLNLVTLTGVCVLLSGVAQAQIKKQVFFGGGATAPRNQGAPATAAGGGFALVIPVHKKVFVRPFAAGSIINPAVKDRPSFASVQVGALAGFKLTPSFTVLGGAAETLLFPKQGTVKLPTLVLSTGTKISKRWGIFTPININSRGTSVSVQLGITW